MENIYQHPTWCIQVDTDIQLRLLEMRHAEEFHKLQVRDQEHARVWMPWADTTLLMENTQTFIKFRLYQFANGESLNLGIWYQGQLVGNIGLNNIQPSIQKAEIGYWLAADVEGKGIMTRSCQALIDYAFNDYALLKVEIHCAEGNTHSRAIPERLGFTQEGIIRQNERLHGQFVNHVIYGLLASEWEYHPSNTIRKKG